MELKAIKDSAASEVGVSERVKVAVGGMVGVKVGNSVDVGVWVDDANGTLVGEMVGKRVSCVGSGETARVGVDIVLSSDKNEVRKSRKD